MLYRAAQSAALAPSREMPHVISNSLSHPADVFIPTWSQGRPAALDVHAIFPLQQQTLGQASLIPGQTLQIGIQCKLTSHLSACQSAVVDFISFVTEALGGLAEDSISTICTIGKAMDQRIGPQDCSTCTKHLINRVAIALWWGNANLRLHHQATYPRSG